MAIANKLHLYVKRSLNKWYEFRKGSYSVQLNGDERKGGPWLEQYAKRLGKDKFMEDFTDILDAIAKDNEVIFAKYGHLANNHPDKQHQIAIFSLYISE